ncbi:MAG: 3-keto-5-aminohexanoate cleavage protein [Woeseiaceae bacterium]|nr:3-keto-5-aminohexanoate cleavage protein [Woeseiaceae bacterium]
MNDRHLEFARSHYMIMSAPNGARLTPEDHPAVPIDAAGLADCAAAVLAAGASAMHVHVRDDDGEHVLDADRYRAALDQVGKRVGDRLILQITTEAHERYTAAEQMQVVRDVRPEAVSLALRELCPDEAAEPAAGKFFQWLVRERIWPQYILYSAAELHRFDTLRRKGFFGQEQPFCLFVLGSHAAHQTGELAELDTILAAADCSQFPWAVCCFGQYELRALRAARRLGGHARVGFENNVTLADGRMAGDNADLVKQLAAFDDDTGREPATADDVRAALMYELR